MNPSLFKFASHLTPLVLFVTAAALAGAVLLVFNHKTSSAQAEVTGVFNDWTAATYQHNGKKVCNMWAKPQLSVGDYKIRGDIYAFVTHYPADKTMSVFSLEMGYPIKPREITVTVGNKNFKFQVSGEFAYGQSTDSKKLIGAFRRGTTMLVSSRSKRGTRTKDTFSLRGFTKAYDHISKNCAR